MKYRKEIPLSQIARIQIYINQKRRSLSQIKGETGADYLLNGGLFNGNWTACCQLKAEGRVLAADPYAYFGYAWDSGPDIAMVTVPAGEKRNYIACVALLRGGLPQVLRYAPELGGARPRSAIGLVGDRLGLYCSDGAVTPEGLQRELLDAGWDSGVMLDGGGSSQCDFAGEKITGGRKVHNLILLYLKKDREETPMKKTVCLDPGHGVETAGKCAPDRSYFEQEFTLDMAKRCKGILERHGVAVTLTRSDSHDVTLPRRVAIANGIRGLNLFVSLHSNASGEGWTAPDGYGIYTGGAGETAARNRAARSLLARAKEAGVALWGEGLFHSGLYVCRHTTAPAILIEHGFHSNRAELEKLKTAAYRGKLAELDCRGILDFLGVEWVAEPRPEAQEPWYAEARDWAVAQGISDGTRPTEPCTRAEVWAMLRSRKE